MLCLGLEVTNTIAVLDFMAAQPLGIKSVSADH
jgi:hypothetical protein